MSREIKFRVWVKDEKKYIPNFVEDNDAGDGYGPLEYDVYYVAPETGAIVKHHSYREFGDWMYSVEATNASREVEIEQYTGLKDKNGKEIYEGDIITETIDDGDNKIIQIYEVYWDEDMLNFGIRGTKGFNYNLHDELWETNASREVLGTIHENPELLEGEK